MAGISLVQSSGKITAEAQNGGNQHQRLAAGDVQANVAERRHKRECSAGAGKALALEAHTNPQRPAVNVVVPKDVESPE